MYVMFFECTIKYSYVVSSLILVKINFVLFYLNHIALVPVTLSWSAAVEALNWPLT